MKNRFIFDLDDTLIYNQHLYSMAQIEFARFTLEMLGPRCQNAQTLINHEVKVDMGLVEKFGMKMERFPTSLRETFLYFGEGMGRSRDSLIGPANQAYEIGMKVFDPVNWKKTLVPEAEETLDFLAGQPDELCLLTTGDERVQVKKIKHFGIERWFANKISIVPRSKSARIRELVSTGNPMKTWFVGNSIRSDIIPALEAGIGAVYIPQETWLHEATHPGLPSSPRLTTLDEISEIMTRYATL